MDGMAIEPDRLKRSDHTSGDMTAHIDGSRCLHVLVAAAADAIVESEVVIKMADGTCDAALFYPSGSGSWPGAVIFADALGLRPAFRDMGRRLAAEGYTVLIPIGSFEPARRRCWTCRFTAAGCHDGWAIA
jgi:hypothetical protein